MSNALTLAGSTTSFRDQGTRMSREEGFAVWLTGLPASGKTTLGRELSGALRERGLPVQILDSDDLRDVLTPDPTYTAEERDWFYRVVAFIAGLLTQNGITVIVAATANRRQYRNYARATIDHFAEVHVRCPLKICMKRDDKGVYEKALAGEATTVPGLQVPYEPPRRALATVDTESLSPHEAAHQILVALERHSFIEGKTGGS